MNLLKILFVLFIAIQPAYAEIEMIEWGDGSNESYIADDSKTQVDIYVTSWCPYCKKAIAYLDAKGIEYNKYDIEEDESAAKRKKELVPNYSGIPLAVINGKIIKGFTEERYSAALEE